MVCYCANDNYYLIITIYIIIFVQGIYKTDPSSSRYSMVNGVGGPGCVSSLCLPQWTRERKYGGADSQWVSIRHPAPRTLALNCANYYYYFLKWNLFVLFICISLMTNDFFLNLFMTVLGLRFCARAFSSCGKWGPLLIAVRGPLTIAASHHRGLSCCGAQAPNAQSQ